MYKKYYSTHRPQLWPLQRYTYILKCIVYTQMCMYITAPFISHMYQSNTFSLNWEKMCWLEPFIRDTYKKYYSTNRLYISNKVHRLYMRSTTVYVVYKKYCRWQILYIRSTIVLWFISTQRLYIRSTTIYGGNKRPTTGNVTNPANAKS